MQYGIILFNAVCRNAKAVTATPPWATVLMADDSPLNIPLSSYSGFFSSISRRHAQRTSGKAIADPRRLKMP